MADLNLQNLPADLPTDWTRGQVVAPDGSAVGLSEKHGYNYLMEQVNEAQKAINALKEENLLLRSAPTEHSLQFQETVIGSRGGYFKTADGVVTIQFSAEKASGGYAKGEVLTVLPEGFRPAKVIEVPVVYGAQSVKPGTVYIQPSGEVVIVLDCPAEVLIYLSCTAFIAAH